MRRFFLFFPIFLFLFSAKTTDLPPVKEKIKSVHQLLKSKGFFFSYDIQNERYLFLKRDLDLEFVPENKFVRIKDRVYRLHDIPKILGGTLSLSSRDLQFLDKLVDRLNPKDENTPPVEARFEDLGLPDFITEKKSSQIDVIFVDAGHGGKDPGAVAYGIQEKDLTLSFAKKLADAVKRANPTKSVLLIRNDDSFIALHERSRLANAAIQKKQNALFVSVHFNAWFDPTIRGFEIYYLSHQESSENARLRALVTRENFSIYKDSVTDLKELEKIFGRINIIQYQKESKFIADSILNSVKEKIKGYPTMKGLKSDLFYVLKGTLMPAVLIEVGFITNREDMEFINDQKNVENFVEAVAEGLGKYIDLFDQTKGLVKDNFILK